MIKRNDRLAAFRSIALFRACSDEELGQIDAVSDEVRIEAGRDLIRQGDLGREFIVLVDRAVTVSRDGEEVATLGPGAHFGELALLVDQPRNATVTAITPVTAQVIDRRGFQSMLDGSPHLTKNLLVSLARRLSEIEEQQH
ncbi:MAG: cyclic nucleotide-binding domain-containing protein [Microthrixaceae bacterium]|nr:cyclic nucleotide-binding domain-containing protein [Microthrixaceae bacterium]MCO5312396.1 cyclic nucleotide-binding domain-containing protein [Microthrixaceae bacterium]HPB45417.1 cyclic nucleotide-binding domain-containing protein [Microthrixaceae bacterium]